jgi:hypothetical protein
MILKWLGTSDQFLWQNLKGKPSISLDGLAQLLKETAKAVVVMASAHQTIIEADTMKTTSHSSLSGSGKWLERYVQGVLGDATGTTDRTQTQFVRNDLRDLIDKATRAHPGLLIQRGWASDAANAAKDAKTKHIERICNTSATPLYTHAFERWLTATTDTKRFVHSAMKIEGRLLIGLTGGGALETGCRQPNLWCSLFAWFKCQRGCSAWQKIMPGEDDVRRGGIEPNEKYPAGLSGAAKMHGGFQLW